jgi:flagellar biosynthesis protein FlhF
MKILKIKSSSMHEALAEARRQLGDDVTVLHTKQCEEPVLLGLAKRQSVEILAAVDTRTAQRLPQVITPAPDLSPADTGQDIVNVVEQIADIREMIAKLDISKSPVSEPERSPVFDRLVRNGVPEAIAEVIASEYKAAKDYKTILDNIAGRISVSGRIMCDARQARVALVGPTGVGKTTTTAKLAALYTHILKKKVALFTLDTYRIGAVEQLAAYARILNIPLEVPLCPEDVDALVAKHSDKDLILIDTVGRSQRNRSDLTELSRFIRSANPTEVHLVVSAASSPAVQKESVECFSRMSASRLILTKLDECPQAGCILGLSANTLLPFSYITCGQEVPDDIAVADKNRLAELVWEGVR